MSVQNALYFINKCRQNKVPKAVEVTSMPHLVSIAYEEGIIFSVEELKKAFQTDWKMRWIKFDKKVIETR